MAHGRRYPLFTRANDRKILLPCLSNDRSKDFPVIAQQLNTLFRNHVHAHTLKVLAASLKNEEGHACVCFSSFFTKQRGDCSSSDCTNICKIFLEEHSRDSRSRFDYSGRSESSRVGDRLWDKANCKKSHRRWA